MYVAPLDGSFVKSEVLLLLTFALFAGDYSFLGDFCASAPSLSEVTDVRYSLAAKFCFSVSFAKCSESF